jgi:hypothetical protein
MVFRIPVKHFGGVDIRFCSVGDRGVFPGFPRPYLPLRIF